MTNFEQIRWELLQENPNALLADGFDKALIGIGRQGPGKVLAVYDREKCIDILVEEGATYEDAEEYF